VLKLSPPCLEQWLLSRNSSEKTNNQPYFIIFASSLFARIRKRELVPYSLFRFEKGNGNWFVFLIQIRKRNWSFLFRSHTHIINHCWSYRPLVHNSGIYLETARKKRNPRHFIIFASSLFARVHYICQFLILIHTLSISVKVISPLFKTMAFIDKLLGGNKHSTIFHFICQFLIRANKETGTGSFFLI
jgi:hypothetical protein